MIVAMKMIGRGGERSRCENTADELLYRSTSCLPLQ